LFSVVQENGKKKLRGKRLRLLTKSLSHPHLVDLCSWHDKSFQFDSSLVTYAQLVHQNLPDVVSFAYAYKLKKVALSLLLR